MHRRILVDIYFESHPRGISRFHSWIDRPESMGARDTKKYSMGLPTYYRCQSRLKAVGGDSIYMSTSVHDYDDASSYCSVQLIFRDVVGGDRVLRRKVKFSKFKFLRVC